METDVFLLCPNCKDLTVQMEKGLTPWRSLRLCERSITTPTESIDK